LDAFHAMPKVAENGAAAPKKGALAGETSPRSPARRESKLSLSDLFNKLDLNGDGVRGRDSGGQGGARLVQASATALLRWNSRGAPGWEIT
jgi:hypothetical protein